MFTERPMNLLDKTHVKSSHLSTIENSSVHVKVLIQEDKQYKIHDMAVKSDLLNLVVHEIIHKKLGYLKRKSY